MKILSRAIVSNSDMIKNYKACREKSEEVGKIFILKNNQPDAVLFSINEYKRISVFIEYLESYSDEEIANLVLAWPKKGNREEFSLSDFKAD